MKKKGMLILSYALVALLSCTLTLGAVVMNRTQHSQQSNNKSQRLLIL